MVGPLRIRVEEEESEKEKALEKEKQLPPGSRCPSTSSGRGLPDREQPRQAEGEGVRESSTVLPGRAEVWSVYKAPHPNLVA